MTKNPMFKVSIIFGACVVVAVAAVVVSTMSNYGELCEVCITYRGRTECREAYGKTQKEAIRTATDNACAVMAGGMTDSIACTNTTPDRKVCKP